MHAVTWYWLHPAKFLNDFFVSFDACHFIELHIFFEKANPPWSWKTLPSQQAWIFWLKYISHDVVSAKITNVGFWFIASKTTITETICFFRTFQNDSQSIDHLANLSVVSACLPNITTLFPLLSCTSANSMFFNSTKMSVIIRRTRNETINLYPCE